MKRSLSAIVAVIMMLSALGVTSVSAGGGPDGWISVPSSVSASGQNESWPYYIQSDNDTKVVDPFCGTDSQQFRVVLYTSANYAGDHVVVCRPQSNFCEVPTYSGPKNVGCWVFCCNNIQDQVSSMVVGDITAAGACIRIFEGANYSLNEPRGWAFEFTSYPNMASIQGSVRNDEMSSLKRRFQADCP